MLDLWTMKIEFPSCNCQVLGKENSSLTRAKASLRGIFGFEFLQAMAKTFKLGSFLILLLNSIGIPISIGLVNVGVHLIHQRCGPILPIFKEVGVWSLLICKKIDASDTDSKVLPVHVGGWDLQILSSIALAHERSPRLERVIPWVVDKSQCHQ